MNTLSSSDLSNDVRLRSDRGRVSVARLVTFGLAFCLGVGALACSDDDDDNNDGVPDDPFVFAMDAPASYTRVDRMGMPAIATAVISSGNKDAYNEDSPAGDAAGHWVADITNNVMALHGALDDDLSGLGLTPCATGDCVGQAAPLVVPDVLSVDPSAASGFPNGRRLSDPVIDVTLAVVLLDLATHPVTLFADLPLNPPANDRVFSNAFPYLAAPHK